jgi:hypothetical protein
MKVLVILSVIIFMCGAVISQSYLTTKANMTFYWATDSDKVHRWQKLNSPQPYRLHGFTLVDSFVSTPNGELAIDLYFYKQGGQVPELEPDKFERTGDANVR